MTPDEYSAKVILAVAIAFVAGALMMGGYFLVRGWIR